MERRESVNERKSVPAVNSATTQHKLPCLETCFLGTLFGVLATGFTTFVRRRITEACYITEPAIRKHMVRYFNRKFVLKFQSLGAICPFVSSHYLYDFSCGTGCKFCSMNVTEFLRGVAIVRWKFNEAVC